MNKPRIHSDAPIYCPMCHKEMAITQLSIENNIDNYAYGRKTSVALLGEQEITLSLKCDECGTLASGIARSAEYFEDELKIHDIKIGDIELRLASLGKEFNPSRR